MRSISVKITLVLVVVSLIGALFTSFYIQNRTQKAFESFIQGQDQQDLVEALSNHYAAQGSWEDVYLVFQDVFPSIQHANQGQGPQENAPNASYPFLLASPTGEVLDTRPGSRGPKTNSSIPMDRLNQGIPLEFEGKTVGWLLPAAYQGPRNNNQQNFLGTVQQGLIISSVVSLLIALTLGGFLIQSFTKPIRKLADATEAVASGELGYQVEINSGDELGRLASSFNSMSTDLEKADLARKQMTADIAHDLRTPLTIMQGYTEALSEGKLAGSEGIFQTMHHQAQHLSYLIDDLKTLSLLDAGELTFQSQLIDPLLVLRQIESAFAPLAREKGIRLNLEAEQNLPRVNLDPERLTQILGNLISNAIQVLPSDGKLDISAHQEGEYLILKVADDGPGISDENLPLIFNRSFRADKSRASENGSSGLGLAITKKLVEAQDGSISVQSAPGAGTTFQVAFPAV
jgi:signal transduction histidine kinase